MSEKKSNPPKLIPDYLEEGSSGTAVNILLAYVKGWAAAQTLPMESWECFLELRCDGTLGPIGMKCVAIYQRRKGLEVAGGCGPQMRVRMQEDGFNFEEAVATAKGQSTFVQPDGAHEFMDAQGWLGPVYQLEV